MRVDAAHYGSERFTPPRRVVVRVSRCADTLSANVFMSLDELASSASRTRTWSACFVKQNKFGALVDLQAWRVTSSVRAPACLASVSLEATALCCSVSQPWYLVKNKTKKNPISHAGLPHSALVSFIMEKGAVVQMGADSTHHSGILNMIGWAENVSQEHWAVFLSWPPRTSCNAKGWTV